MISGYFVLLCIRWSSKKGYYCRNSIRNHSTQSCPVIAVDGWIIFTEYKSLGFQKILSSKLSGCPFMTLWICFYADNWDQQTLSIEISCNVFPTLILVITLLVVERVVEKSNCTPSSKVIARERSNCGEENKQRNRKLKTENRGRSNCGSSRTNREMENRNRGRSNCGSRRTNRRSQFNLRPTNIFFAPSFSFFVIFGWDIWYFKAVWKFQTNSVHAGTKFYLILPCFLCSQLSTLSL